MINARSLPWALACIGAFQGWTFPALERTGESWTAHHPGGLLPAIAFGAALFVAGWIHTARPRHEHRRLGAAALRILVACLAFGLAPIAIMFPMGNQVHVPGDLLPPLVLVALGTLPPALLLVHAAAPRSAPRTGALLVGVDRAEDSLVFLAAMLSLPWWRSHHPVDTACLLVALALPAVAIGLHTIALSQRARLFAMASSLPPARPSYRTQGRSEPAVAQGDPALVQREARRVLAWSVGIVAVAAGQQAALLLQA